MFSWTHLMGGKNARWHHPTGPFMEKWMMAMVQRAQLMKKMHDGNNLTDPSRG
jgi:hypothetical protein